MRRILIADDSAIARRALRALIETHEEWNVVGEAENGQDAIARVRELHPDVVVLDLVMPRMNGLEAARELAKIEPQLPILLCTVQFSPHLVAEARRSGVQGAVPKAEARQITEAISALLDHHTFYSQPSAMVE
jgi:DNA-binding NarL/FixJ family response regulator